MVNFWVAKVKCEYCELKDVRDVYYDRVLAQLVKEGFYNEQGECILRFLDTL